MQVLQVYLVMPENNSSWCDMLLTGLHLSPVVGILFLSSNSSILHLPSLTSTRVKGNHHHLPLSFPPVRARELGAIIIPTQRFTNKSLKLFIKQFEIQIVLGDCQFAIAKYKQIAVLV